MTAAVPQLRKAVKRSDGLLVTQPLIQRTE